MKKPITIDGVKYLIDIERSMELGVLTTPTRPVTFNDVKVGEVFLFSCYGGSYGGSKGLFVKESNGEYATRIAGVNNFYTEIGNACEGCSFNISGTTTFVSVLRNGKFISEIAA